MVEAVEVMPSRWKSLQLKKQTLWGGLLPRELRVLYDTRISGPYESHKILAPAGGFSISLIILLALLTSFLLLEKIAKMSACLFLSPF